MWLGEHAASFLAQCGNLEAVQSYGKQVGDSTENAKSKQHWAATANMYGPEAHTDPLVPLSYIHRTMGKLC